MAENRSKYISRILQTFVKNRFSADMEKKIQGWYYHDSHREEKDAALRELYDAMPTGESEYSRVTLREIGIKLGFAVRRNNLLRRYIMRVAALLIPIAFIVGAFFIYDNALERKVRSERVVVAVDNGVQRVITLSDDSQVWLNHRAEVEYLAEFGEERSLSLSGEAFFKVAHDKKRPFTVKAGGLSIRVLGTEFNVEAYENSNITVVALLSGSIEVDSEEKTIHLQPLDKLIYNRLTGKITLTKIDHDEHDWRAVKLNFERMPLEDIFRALETYYGVKIELPLSHQYDEPISLRLSGNESVEQVLQILCEISGRLKFEIDNDKIVIKPMNQFDE